MRFAMATFLALGLALSLAGCASSTPHTTEVSSKSPPEVRLGAGDRIRITVFGEESLTGEYLVGNDGKIGLPLIGQIEAANRTVDELQRQIADALAPDIVLNPKVTVNVLSFRPFFLLGEVEKPGQYPYVSALSVDQAIAGAGGYTYRASTRRAYIRRANSETEESFDLGFDKRVWVMPGDTIRIGQKYL